MANFYPSGRPSTETTPEETAALMIGDRRPNPIVAIQTWSALKARQILEDGTSARIEGDRAHRLTLLRLRHPECWAPVPRAFENRTVAEAVAAALPAIRAAVARHTPQGSAS